MHDSARGQNNGSRLIIPGRGNPSNGNAQPSPSRQGGSGLILPGQDGPHRGSRPQQPGSTPVHNFRPPPGFMDKKLEYKVEKQAAAANPQELLAKLKSNSGYWHQLAKYLPILQAAGYDWMYIENETGIERALQSIWAIAGLVYDTLQSAGNFPADKLKYFDTEDSEYKLYPMRILPVDARTSIAEYIVDQNLTTTESEVLSRAFKEHARRSGEKLGFAATPADALAFKHYRDGVECRQQKDKAECAERGLEVAETETARERLRELLQTEKATLAAAAPVSDPAQLAVFRLTNDELSCRPVAVAGNWETLTASDIQEAPTAARQHPFNIFTTQGDQQQWVGMPAWSAIVHAHQPVAALVSDCQQLGVLMQQAKKTEDKKRLQGPGLLLLDKVAGAIRDTEYYVTPGSNGLQLVSGSQANQAAVVARVLLCSRPPRAEIQEKAYP